MLINYLLYQTIDLVEIGKVISALQTVKFGVSQGTVLGPVLS